MLEAFGSTVDWGGGTFVGIYGNPYGETEDGMVSGTLPSVLARSSDIETAALTNGSTVTIDSVSYVIRTIEPDNEGLTVLTLEAL